jgi:beta-glucosidase
MAPRMVAGFAFVLLGGGPAADPAASEPTPSSIESRVDGLLRQMTLEEKIDLLGGVDSFYLRGVPRLGVPRMKMADGPIGVRGDLPATTMAAGISLAATWDTELAREIGTEIGRDARARGVHFLLGPGVNLYVAPMNGRNFEYLGEDPFLAGRIAVGYIEGIQSQGVAATIKHLVANNSDFDRHRVDAILAPRTLRELYLPAFEAAVKDARVGAIMTSYNLVNGVHLSEDGALNNDVVKKEWGFDGVIMSDWTSTYGAVSAANGGLDVEMPSGRYMNRTNLLPAIEKGQVTAATIDDKVRRILRLAVRFGWLDREQQDRSVPVRNPDGRRIAEKAAREGIVLLKNERDLLPLARPKIQSVAVIGPGAYPAVPAGGGSAGVRPFAAVSAFEGLADALSGEASVHYHRALPTVLQLARTTHFTTTAGGGTPGLLVESFDNPRLEGPPASTGTERHVNRKPAVAFEDLDRDQWLALYELGGRTTPARTPGSSVRWTGYYTPAVAGACEIVVHAPGERSGYRVFVDDELVIDGWEVRKALVDHAVVTLAAGPHKVVLERFESGGFDSFLGIVRLGIAPQTTLVDPAARALAEKADVVVVAVGFDNESETEASDRTFGLPIGQDQLIREMSAVNPNTVVVVTAGGAVDTRGWLGQVPVLLHSWYAGEAGGTALAKILLGEANPSGRLPISYDRSWDESPSVDSYYPEPGTRRVVYENGVFLGYRGYERRGTAPLFPFGFGLSYTTFRYDNLKIRPAAGDARGPRFEVAFDVTNTGSRPGADVAQLYVSDPRAGAARPPKELKGFARLELQPDETKTATITLDARAFASYDERARKWRASAGDFGVLVGRSSADIALRGTIKLPRALSLGPGR